VSFGVPPNSWKQNASGQDLDEVAELFLNFIGTAQGLRNFGLDGVAKLLAKAMDGYLDGTGRQAEFFRGISLRKVFRVAHEPGFEHLELLTFSCLLQAFLYAG